MIIKSTVKLFQLVAFYAQDLVPEQYSIANLETRSNLSASFVYIAKQEQMKLIKAPLREPTTPEHRPHF